MIVNKVSFNQITERTKQKKRLRALGALWDYEPKNRLFRVVLNVVRSYFDNRVSSASAEMSYYFLFSFFPFLIFLNGIIASLNLNSEKIFEYSSKFLPSEIEGIVMYYFEYINNSKLLITSGIMLTFWTLSRAVNGLSYAVNRAHRIEKEQLFQYKFIKSVVFTIIIMIMIYVTIAIVLIGEHFIIGLSGILPVEFTGTTLYIWSKLRFLLLGVILFASIMLVYYFMPNKKMSYRSVFPGAVFVIFAEISSSWVFSFYVKKMTRQNVLYGVLGATLLLALWLYLTAMIIILGSEINHAVEVVYSGDERINRSLKKDNAK